MEKITIEGSEPLGVKIHPIALLSIVDHHERTVGNKQNKRALGVLLGESNRGVYDITNAYAIPFDEDTSKEGVWFIDHNYHEVMCNMSKKVNVKEKVLGWYVTGSTFKPHDIDINELFASYAAQPVLIVADVKAKQSIDLPFKAFYSVKNIDEAGLVYRSFKNIACSVSAFEAEEVGVEHLVREIKDLNMDSLKNRLENKIKSLGSLEAKIATIVQYLDDVAEGRKRSDKQIIATLQEIMSKLPKIVSEDLKRIMSTEMNNNYISLYVSAVLKNVVNIHNLLNNKISALEERKELAEALKNKEDQKKEEKKEEVSTKA